MVDRSARAWAWPALCAVFLLFFAVTRLYELQARPLHHDEGVNSMFVKTLIEKNQWKYDPANYHGPTLFLFQIVPTWITTFLQEGAARFDRHSISGITVVSMRATVALIGLLLLALILRAWPLLGRIGAASACLFTGLSCDILFFNRYFIHESYVLLFTFGLVWWVYQYRQTRNAAHLGLAALSAVLLFCTKETAIFHFAVLGLAWLCADLVLWLSSGRERYFSLREKLRAPASIFRELGVSASLIFLVCVIVWATFYTSFFTNPWGPIDSLRTFFYWAPEGVESGHAKPFFYYFTEILLRYEPVILMFAFVGMAAAFVRNDRKGLFLTFWALGMAGFYSVVPYKTPWLVVNISLPMAVVAGYGVQAVANAIRERLSRPHAVTTIISLSGMGIFLLVAEARQTWRVNFVEYDNDRHPQIYAHTSREIFDALNRIEAVAARAGNDMPINIVSEIYWPLPFYLTRYSSARFWGQRVAEIEVMDAPVLIVAPRLQADVDKNLKDTYTLKTFNLRGGVPLVLYLNTRLSSPVELPPLTLTRPVRKPSDLKSGLVLVAFKGKDFKGKPDRVEKGDSSFDFVWNHDAEKRFTAPFSLRWTGFLKVDTAGEYWFGLESDDGSWLKIDGEMVIDNGGDHPALRMNRKVTLSAGYHRIELSYFDTLGQALLKLRWTPPGSAETALPSAALFHQP